MKFGIGICYVTEESVKSIIIIVNDIIIIIIIIIIIRNMHVNRCSNLRRKKCD